MCTVLSAFFQILTQKILLFTLWKLRSIKWFRYNLWDIIAVFDWYLLQFTVCLNLYYICCINSVSSTILYYFVLLVTIRTCSFVCYFDCPFTCWIVTIQFGDQVSNSFISLKCFRDILPIVIEKPFLKFMIKLSGTLKF